MTESKGVALVYPRLMFAYFCTFAIWGAWAAALGGYIYGVLNFTGAQIGLIYSAMPIGAIIAPLLIGPIADRYFSAQKVMAILHLISGLALLAGYFLCISGMENLFVPLMVLMLIQGLCYTPAMGLVNTVVFKHIPSASMAPYVFVFGAIGWIFGALCVAAFDGDAATPLLFLVAAIMSIVLTLYSLTLPHTPPKGAPVAGEKSGNMFEVLSLLKNYSFLIFLICVFFASIPANNYFWPGLATFLSDRGYPSPVGLSTINQFSEILLMFALAFCIPRIGLKNVLLIGMAAWSLRWFFFSIDSFGTAVVGLLLHGFCFAFLYIASYMYADKVAPDNLKASAQSLMVFLLIGVAQLIGGQWFGAARDANPPKHSTIVVATTQLTPTTDVSLESFAAARVPIPAWNDEETWLRHLDLAAHVKRIRGVKEEAPAPHLGMLLAEHGQRLTPASIDAIDVAQLSQTGVALSQMTVVGGIDVVLAESVDITADVQFTKDNLKTLAAEIAGTENFSITRAEWLAAQSRDWAAIYRVPAIFIAVFFVIFLIFGREPKEAVVVTEEAKS